MLQAMSNLYVRSGKTAWCDVVDDASSTEVGPRISEHEVVVSCTIRQDWWGAFRQDYLQRFCRLVTLTPAGTPA